MGLPPDFSPDFSRIAEDAGVQHRREDVPAEIDLKWLKVKCGHLEKVLRNQYRDPEDTDRDRKLPRAWESALSRYPPTDTGLALQRYAYLKHLYIVRNEGLRKREKSDPDQQLTAFRVLTREPIEVDIGTRIVKVTDRSLAALVQIARHDARIRALGQTLDAVYETRDAVMGEAQGTNTRQGRRHVLKKVAWLLELEERALFEVNLQRQALFAHVFTADGEPADSYRDAPEWWQEITRDAEMLIIRAVNAVGVDRYNDLGPQPEPPASDDKHGRWKTLEDLGWLTVVTRWGIKVPIVPASYFDRPLAQAAAQFRFGADPVYEKRGG